MLSFFSILMLGIAIKINFHYFLPLVCDMKVFIVDLVKLTIRLLENPVTPFFMYTEGTIDRPLAAKAL